MPRVATGPGTSQSTVRFVPSRPRPSAALPSWPSSLVAQRRRGTDVDRAAALAGSLLVQGSDVAADADAALPASEIAVAAGDDGASDDGRWQGAVELPGAHRRAGRRSATPAERWRGCRRRVRPGRGSSPPGRPRSGLRSSASPPGSATTTVVAAPRAAAVGSRGHGVRRVERGPPTRRAASSRVASARAPSRVVGLRVHRAAGRAASVDQHRDSRRPRPAHQRWTSSPRDRRA